MTFLRPRLPALAWPRLVLLGAALAGLPAAVSALEITLPPETVFFQPSSLPGYAVATAYCATCHSTDYVRTQPISPLATWKAEVLKMKKVYGCPIPDDQMDVIADYLFKTYGTGKSVPAGESPPPGR